MNAPPVPTFVQNSRIGRTIFQLKGDTLLVSDLGPAGGGDRTIDLRSIDPDYQPEAFRVDLLVIMPLLMAAVSALVVWGVSRLFGAIGHVVPGGMFFHLALWPLLIFAGSLRSAIRGSRRVERFVFCDHRQKPLFAIVCEREQREECRSFMALLVAAIESVQSGLPAEDRSRLLAEISAENRAAEADPPLPKWALSLACGVFAGVFPRVPWVGRYFYEDLFLFFLAACVGAMAFCYYSFDQREPRRHWSLLGAALALAGIFIR